MRVACVVRDMVLVVAHQVGIVADMEEVMRPGPSVAVFWKMHAGRGSREEMTSVHESSKGRFLRGP